MVSNEALACINTHTLSDEDLVWCVYNVCTVVGTEKILERREEGQRLENTRDTKYSVLLV